ncbi:hypothetical protein NOGI109294_13815 [Nocardiopsis gilva]|uniref:hypothetical protein n=1 Tax=Nocardiopsis gilva TaxID=280236 RepID=UPI0003468872|nr:hypothetical protein [Nocardiopsis gilva]
MADSDFPRPLSKLERDVITALLSVPASWAQELRDQIDSAVVTRAWGSKSPSIDLSVDVLRSRAEIAEGPLPLTATVASDEGELVGELLLWTENGRLSALEYAWYTDEPPESLPDPGRICVSPERN